MSDFPFSIPRRTDDTTREYVKVADYVAKEYPLINGTDNPPDSTPSILGATGSNTNILESSSTPSSYNTTTGKYTVLNDGVFLVSIAVRGADTGDAGARQRCSICKNGVQPTLVGSFMPRDNFSAARHFYEMSQLLVCSAGDTISAFLIDNVPNVAADKTIQLFEMFIVKIN